MPVSVGSWLVYIALRRQCYMQDCQDGFIRCNELCSDRGCKRRQLPSLSDLMRLSLIRAASGDQSG